MPTYDGIGETITHKLELEGDMFLQDIEGGSLSTQVPLEIFSDFGSSGDNAINSRMLRLRVQNCGETDVSNSYVTDFGIRGEADKDYFFITAPQNTSNVGDQNTFVISKTSNVGIGTTDPGTYRLLVNNSSTKQFGVPGDDTPTTGDTLIYTEAGEWVYAFPAGNLPAGSINNEILTWNGANWVPNSSIITTNSNTAIGIGTYTPSANLHVIGSVTATSDVNISGAYQGGKLRVGSLLSAVPTNPNVTVPGDLTVSGTLTSDEWIHTDNVTITGNLKCQTLTASDIVGGSPLTISATSIAIESPETMSVAAPMSIGTMTVSNIFHSDQLTMSANVFVTEGSILTLSKIFHTDTVTMSANIAMDSDKTLTTSNIETSNLTVSNRLSGGTISVSNIEATANLVVGGPVDITGTLSAAGITSSADVNVTGSITTSNIVAHANENLLISSNLEVGTSNLFVNTANGNVGIGTDAPLSTARLDVRGDGMVFDKAEGDGTILIGLYNWVDTQSLLIDRGAAHGTVTASTDYDPPPGTAGDVICKFQNTGGGESFTGDFYPGLTGSIDDVFTFGVWALATQDVAMEFFINPGGTGSAASSFTVVGDGTWRFYQVSVTLTAGTNINMFFRIDNNSSGRTVYLTGASIRKNPTTGVVLPFTPRYSPIDGKGTVFATQNLVAKEAAIKTLTGNVGIGKTNPSYKLDVSGDVQLQGAVGHALYDSFTAPNSVENMPHYGIKWASTGGSGPTGHMSGYGGLRFFTVGSARMSIAQGGNVGIGTTNPGQKLEVGYYGGALSSDFGAIRITNHATNLHETSIARFDISLGDIDAGTGSGRRKLIFNSKTNTLASGTDILCLDGEYNNVGIGIASPNHKLDVNGVIKSQNTRFSAYSSQANTVYPILTPFILEHTNENTGSAYNTSNGIFTVPVTGVYCFQATVYLLGTASQIVFLYRSSSSAGWQDLQPGGNDFILTCGAHSANSFSMTYKFNANNQIAIGIRSDVNANIWIYRSHTYFSGFLISPS